MSQITLPTLSTAQYAVGAARGPVLRRGQVAWRAARSAGFVAGLTLALALVPAALASMLTNNGAPPVVPHELIAQEGGVIKVMRVVGGHLWMGFGPRLVAVDTADPGAPRIVGRSPLLGGSVQDLAIGSAHPNAVGARADVAWALLAGNSLVGLDITDPAHPAPLGSVEVLTTCVGVAAVGDHVWLATQEGDLVGYDVGDPLAPTPAGRLDDIAGRMDVQRVGAVAGHVVLATSGYGSPGTPILHVIDVRDPQHPQEVAALANPGPKDWLLRDMYIDDRIAWIVGGYPGTLVGVDLTIPSAPAVLVRLESDDIYIVERVTVAEGRAYLTGGDGGHNYFETAVVDVRDPTAPRLLASHALPRTSDPTTGMAGTGGHLWYGTYDGHLFVLDARNGSSGLPTVANVQTIGSAGQMSVAGDLGLLSLGEAVLTLDLHRPDAPLPLTTTLVHYYPNALAIAGNAAFVITQGNMDVLGGELHVLRINEPAAPKVVANLYGAHDPQQVAITGSLAALLATSKEHDWGNHEVWLLQTSGPSTPARLATMPILGGVQDVAFGGRLVYALSPDLWTSDPAAVALVIGDVSDPQSPSPMSTLRLTGLIPQHARARLAAEGHVAYVVTWGHDTDYRRVVENALHVVDASDPKQPVRVAKVPLEAPPAGISVAHGHLFLPGAGGVQVFDVRDPTIPTPKGFLPTGGDAAVDAVVQDGLVYVTAGGGGLYVFSPQLDGWPTPAIPPTPTATPETLTATASPPRPLPDLTGFALYDCWGLAVHVTVRNVGSADAGPFEVRSEAGRASWRVRGLGAGATLNLDPKRQSPDGGFVLIDADQEVVESDEANNRIEVPFVTCPPHRLMFPVLLDGSAIRD